MLIDLDRGFIFVAGLRSGSTSIERALAPRAHIRLTETRFGKHMSLAEAGRHFAWIAQCRALRDFSVFGVARDPVGYLLSLHRFHQKPDFDGLPHSTRGMSFARFIDEWTPRAWHAQPQIDRFMAPGGGFARVRIWNFRHLDRLEPEIGRLAPGVALQRLNATPDTIAAAAVDAPLAARIRARFAADAALTAADVVWTDVDPRDGATLDTRRAEDAAAGLHDAPAR